jgi:hypothetical protein
MFMKKLLLMLLFAAPLAFGFASLPTVDEDCACDAPSNIVVSGKASGSVTYSWDAVPRATSYTVKYERLSDGYKSEPQSKTSTSHTFTGLAPGAYKFFFAANCGEEASGFIVIEDLNGT